MDFNELATKHEVNLLRREIEELKNFLINPPLQQLAFSKKDAIKLLGVSSGTIKAMEEEGVLKSGRYFANQGKNMYKGSSIRKLIDKLP